MPASPDPVSPGVSPDPVSPAATSRSSSSHPGAAPGLVLAPFRALRFDSARAGDLTSLTSPPYDVIDADAVRALEASNDHNIVRLILPRDSAEDGADTDVVACQPTDRYVAARRRLEAWREERVLRPDDQPALYVYEQADAATGHVQRGLVGALHLSPPEDDIVLPHENTMAGPVSDRLALYTAVEADLEPIFLVYDGGGAASRAVAEVDSSGAALLVDATLPDGLRHRVWALTDSEQLAEIAADLLPRTALIADGHHRYATYLARQAARRASGAGDGPWDRGLTFLVDASAFGPQVHPIHRVIPGRAAADLAERAAAGMTVLELDGPERDGPEHDGPEFDGPEHDGPEFDGPEHDGPELDAGLGRAMQRLAEHDGPAYLLVGDGRCWLAADPDPSQLAAALGDGHSAAWSALDVSVLHGYVVPTLWQLADREDTVGYEHDVQAALAAASRSGGTAVLLKATPVEAVTAVAARGERMPRKSTLFTPKPRTGLLVRDHRDELDVLSI